MKPKWQKARILKVGNPEYAFIVGCTLWTEIGRLEPCGGNFCEIPSIYVNHQYNSPFGPDQDVNHLDTLEMLSEFADDVPMLTWEEFLAECRATLKSSAPES